MRKKFLVGGIIFVLLAAIPLTVFFLQKQQETRSRATPSTTLSLALSDPTQTVGVNQEFSVDAHINPGSNQVSFIKLQINYDATKINVSGQKFEVNTTAFPVILEGPTYNTGSILVTVSVGADPTRVIQSTTKIGKITFKALSPTNGSIQLATFGNQTQVLSIASADAPSENVLSTTSPLTMAITQAAPTTPTALPSATPSTPPRPTTAAVLPICLGLNVDRATTGTAPFSITFTANGRDADGTISKVNFDFGDGPIQTVTDGGGIGTNLASVSMVHTYNNPSSFNAKVTFVDNQGNISASGTECSKTIIVTQITGTPAPTSSKPTITTTPTPTKQITATPTTPVATPTAVIARTTIVDTGPGDTIVAAGGIGVILSVIGAILFFAL